MKHIVICLSPLEQRQLKEVVKESKMTLDEWVMQAIEEKANRAFSAEKHDYHNN